MKEALLESLLRKMRLNRVLPTIKSFDNPHLLDIGCGWEARLLREVEPFIAKGVGIDFKAPDIRTQKLHTFSYFFESKGADSLPNAGQSQVSSLAQDSRHLDSAFNGGGGENTNAPSQPESTSKNTAPTNSASKNKPVSLPFENESFEVVTLLAVLEHLNHPKEMCEEIARVLKPRGIAILTIPSHLAKPVLEFLAYKLHIVSKEEIDDHKRYYNRKDLAELIDSVPNLTLLKHKYFQLGMNNFALLQRVE